MKDRSCTCMFVQYLSIGQVFGLPSFISILLDRYNVVKLSCVRNNTSCEILDQLEFLYIFAVVFAHTDEQ